MLHAPCCPPAWRPWGRRTWDRPRQSQACWKPSSESVTKISFCWILIFAKCFQNKLWWLWSVGRAVASNFRGPRFESSHWQKYIFNIYCIEKTKIKKKMPRMANFFKIFNFQGIFLSNRQLYLSITRSINLSLSL